MKVSVEFRLGQQAKTLSGLWTGPWAVLLSGVRGQLALSPALASTQSAKLSRSHKGHATVLAEDRILHSNGKIPAPCGGEVQENEGGQRHREVSLMKMHIVGCFPLPTPRTGTNVAPSV